MQLFLQTHTHIYKKENKHKSRHNEMLYTIFTTRITKCFNETNLAHSLEIRFTSVVLSLYKANIYRVQKHTFDNSSSVKFQYLYISV